ncbi:MAG: T9SS type A sorting domain-containing protein [Dysgonamonadaceae bacterium]|nr:T9SS type A sorting domain-containing protein [Dysgonamonadaceae bacterium]
MERKELKTKSKHLLTGGGLLLKSLLVMVCLVMGSWSAMADTVFKIEFATNQAERINGFEEPDYPSIGIAFSNTSTNINQTATNASSGYTGASGLGVVLLNSSDLTLTLTGINTSDYSNLQLSFGLKRGKSNDQASGNIKVEYQDVTNGGSWTELTLPSTTFNTAWALITASGTIPSTSNLSLRFTHLNSTARGIDDILLTGTALPKYTIEALSNNTSYGNVSLLGKVITATPENCYQVSSLNPYTVSPVGSATVIQNGNIFSVTPTANTTVTINFEAKTTYTVTFYNEGVVYDTKSSCTIAFPVAPISACSADGWIFAGWSKSPISAGTTKPTLYTEATYTPANESLYAVYKKVEGIADTYSLTGTLTDGDYVIGAIIGTAGTDNEIAAMNATVDGGWLKYTKTTPSGGSLTMTDMDHIWTLTTGSGFTLKNKSTNEYLVLSGTGSGSADLGNSPTAIYVDNVNASTFEILTSALSTVSSGNQLACNLATNMGYRMYVERTHQATATGISTQIRFYKSASTTTYNSNPTCSSSEMVEFWLEAGETASFDENKWRVKYDGAADWEPQTTLVAVPEDNLSIQRILISGTATVPANDGYMTDVLEIATTGKLHALTGSTLMAVEAIMHSDDTNTAQMKSVVADDLDIGVLKVKKTFQNEEWYMVSFPFDVAEIQNANGDRMFINPSTPTGVWGKTYNGASRASGSYSANTSTNWTLMPTNTVTLTKNTGYLFGQDFGTAIDGASGYQTLTFISATPAPADAWTFAPKTHAVTEHPSDNVLHKGWNLIGNPNTSGYHLRNNLSDYVTYVYNRVSNSYNADYGIIEPFKAFFVQVEDGTTSIDFEEGGIVFRSATASPYDQIKLSLTKDGSFYDYFAVRVGDQGFTTGYDLNKDAQKMLSPISPQLYSCYNSIDYAINAIPETENVMPLAYKVPAAGDYTIRLEDGLSENVSKLLLIDKENENAVTDLLATPSYSFTANGAQSNTGRFELQFELFSPNAPTSVASVAAGKITVVTNGQQLILHGLETLSNVSLYDIAGKKAATFTKVDNNQPILLNHLTGVYVIKIENNSQAGTAKVVLK